MRVVKVAATAEQDLQDILEYVSQNNLPAADKLIRDIVRKFAFLRDNPQAGILRSRLMINLRSFVTRNYFIFYLPIENGIEILRVLHSSRDIEAIFEEFFDSI